MKTKAIIVLLLCGVVFGSVLDAVLSRKVEVLERSDLNKDSKIDNIDMAILFSDMREYQEIEAYLAESKNPVVPPEPLPDCIEIMFELSEDPNMVLMQLGYAFSQGYTVSEEDPNYICK